MSLFHNVTMHCNNYLDCFNFLDGTLKDLDKIAMCISLEIRTEDSKMNKIWSCSVKSYNLKVGNKKQK